MGSVGLHFTFSEHKVGGDTDTEEEEEEEGVSIGFSGVA